MDDQSSRKQDNGSASKMRVERLAPEIVAILRTKTSAERLEMAYAMHAFARERLASHLRFAHGDWTDQQIASEVSRRMLWNSAT
jgi:hypothetical protein